MAREHASYANESGRRAESFAQRERGEGARPTHHGEHHHAQHMPETGPRHNEAHGEFSRGHAMGHMGSCGK